MSGILFLAEICIFVLIVYWSHVNDRRDSMSGLFAMKDGSSDGAWQTIRDQPRWQRRASYSRTHAQLRRNEPSWCRMPRWKAYRRPRG